MNPGSSRYVTVVAYDLQLDNGGEGTPFAEVSLRIVEGPDTGKNIRKRCYLSEKAAPISMEQLRALGWTGTKLSKAMQEGLGTVKARAQLKVKQLDNGKIVEDTSGIYPLSAPKTKNAVDSSSLEAFDAMFADYAAATETVAVTELNRAPAELPAPVASNGAKKTAPANPNALDF
jgi:hypothetical protein